MGWCPEFGAQITEGCGDAMVAGADRCTCAACGTDCPGRFAGCEAVWAHGPRYAPDRPAPEPRVTGDEVPVPARAETTNGVLPSSAPMLATDDGRAEVLAWFQSAFDEVRAELRALDDTARRQQRAINRMARRDNREAARLAELADELPARVHEALADADAAAERERRERQAAHEELAERVEQARAAAESSAGELRAEVDRLAEAQRALAERPPVLFDQDALPRVAGAAWQAVRARVGTKRTSAAYRTGPTPPSPPAAGGPAASAANGTGSAADEIVVSPRDGGRVEPTSVPPTEGTECD